MQQDRERGGDREERRVEKRERVSAFFELVKTCARLKTKMRMKNARMPNASREKRGKRGEEEVEESRGSRGEAVWTAAIWGYA